MLYNSVCRGKQNIQIPFASSALDAKGICFCEEEFNNINVELLLY